MKRVLPGYHLERVYRTQHRMDEPKQNPEGSSEETVENLGWTKQLQCTSQGTEEENSMNKREVNRERTSEISPLFFNWTVIITSMGGKYPKRGKSHWKGENRTSSDSDTKMGILVSHTPEWKQTNKKHKNFVIHQVEVENSKGYALVLGYNSHRLKAALGADLLEYLWWGESPITGKAPEITQVIESENKNIKVVITINNMLKMVEECMSILKT